jgi:translation initiation factor 2B subunit (eIF-2B alpha/beta/delta family)
MLFAVIGAVSLGGVFSQEKKEPPIKGKLPANYSKLGLTDEQKQAVYKAQAKYAEKIDKLKAEIKALQAEEKKDVEAVLTPEQKKRLVELLTGAKEPDKKEPSKKEPDKKEPDKK